MTPDVNIKEKALLVRIDKTYNPDKTKSIYDCARSSWYLDYDNGKYTDCIIDIKFVFAVYNYKIVEVFNVTEWEKVNCTDNSRNYDRWSFIGNPNSELHSLYINENVKHYFKTFKDKKGKTQYSSTAFVNCD